MFRKILVPTDDSECASVAADYAANLASYYDATVRVLNVVDSRRIATGPHYDECREDAAKITTSVADRLDRDDIMVEQAVRTGIPYTEILADATEHNVDLIVIGTHGRTGVDRYLLGSVTEKVVRRSDVPVLTIRTPNDVEVTFPYTDVLVPTDGSKGAVAAIAPAIDIASTYGATLHSLSVVETRSLGIDVRSSATSEVLEEMAQEAVDTVQERATAASVSKTETGIDYGLPSECIRSYIEANGIDLVVMGTHGRSGIPRYLLGSVAERLVRTSPAPVMTIRDPLSDKV